MESTVLFIEPSKAFPGMSLATAWIEAIVYTCMAILVSQALEYIDMIWNK